MKQADFEIFSHCNFNQGHTEIWGAGCEQAFNFQKISPQFSVLEETIQRAQNIPKLP